MINWTQLLFSGTWVFGLSLILASISYSFGYPSRSSEPIGQRLIHLFNRPALWLGFVFLSIGLAGNSNSLLELLIWLMLGLGSGYFAWDNTRNNESFTQ